MQQWLERYRGFLLFVLVVVALAAVILFQALRPGPQPIHLSTATPSPLPAVSPTTRLLRVYVSGAVHQPEVYALSPGSIVKDAILAAGGAANDADLDRINLALPVADGQHVYVPHLGEENPPVPSRAGSPLSGGTVNINTADAAALESLPGIGPALASRILDYREAHGPFAQIEEIMDVAGIGPATFEGIRELITVE